MIESIARGRSDYDDCILQLYANLAQLARERGISVKICQVDVLFDPIVPPHLPTCRTITAEILIRKSLRHDHHRGQAKREMICGLMFVVHQRDTTQAESARC